MWLWQCVCGSYRRWVWGAPGDCSTQLLRCCCQPTASEASRRCASARAKLQRSSSCSIIFLQKNIILSSCSQRAYRKSWIGNQISDVAKKKKKTECSVSMLLTLIAGVSWQRCLQLFSCLLLLQQKHFLLISQLLSCTYESSGCALPFSSIRGWRIRKVRKLTWRRKAFIIILRYDQIMTFSQATQKAPAKWTV